MGRAGQARLYAKTWVISAHEGSRLAMDSRLLGCRKRLNNRADRHPHEGGSREINRTSININ